MARKWHNSSGDLWPNSGIVIFICKSAWDALGEAESAWDTQVEHESAWDAQVYGIHWIVYGIHWGR